MTTPAKTSVIVTRPEPDASAFARLVEDRGLSAILSPVMRIALHDIHAEVAGAKAVAFTSANGVRSYLASEGPLAPPAFCVGERTAQAAREAGFSSVETADGDVSSLFELIAARLGRSFELTHVVGRDEAGDLTGELGRRGFRVRKVIGYAAEPLERLSPAGLAALKAAPGVSLWVAFFSARSARLFEGLAARAGAADRLASCGAACLSETVAGSLKREWGAVVTSQMPDGAALIDAILKAR